MSVYSHHWETRSCHPINNVLTLFTVESRYPKWNFAQRSHRVGRSVKFGQFSKDNLANLLHAGDNLEADKWIDNI